MTKTREQLRDVIRRQVGDEVRLSGTATGGSTITIIDTTNLMQVDDYWNRRKVHVTDTTGDAAPEGETRNISDFDNGTNTITSEMPFSAAVEAGDTYQICVWANIIYNQIVTAAIATYSRFRPYKTTGTFATSIGTRRFTPPSGLDLRAGHRIDEIRYIDNSTMEDYVISNWNVDVHQNKIDMGYFYTEAKTYTVFWTTPHDDYSDDDSDTITISDDDEDLLVKWIRAQFWLMMAKEGFDDFGQLQPAKWTRGRVSEETGKSRRNMRDLYGTEMEEWVKQMKNEGLLYSKVSDSVDKGEWVPPRDYRVSADGLY